MGCGQTKSAVVVMANVMTVEEVLPSPCSTPGHSSDSADSLHLPFASLVEQKQQMYAWDQYTSIIKYQVDRQGIIQSIPTERNWDAAAAEGGAELPVSAVLGRSLFQFLTPLMAAFYSEVLTMLNHSALRSSVSFRWFCDTPTHRRETVLLLIQLGDTIAVLSVTVDEVPHDAGFLAHVQYVEDGDRKSCAFCNRFLKDGRWLLPEEYRSTLAAGEVEGGPLPVCQVSCPQCSERLVWRLAPNFHRTRHCFKGMAPLFPGSTNPHALDALLAPLQPHSALGLLDGALQPTGSLRVLLVNDDLITAWVIEALLRGLGHKPVLLTEAEAVPLFLQDNSVAVVLIDMVLAGSSACDLIRALRRDQPRTPVVALSGCLPSRMAARKAGAKEFLLKPVTGIAIQKVLEPFCAAKCSVFPSGVFGV